MNDNNNELLPTDDNSNKARLRAERIRAIKNSIRNTEVLETPDFPLQDLQENDEKISNEAAVDATNLTAVDDWENELVQRIARRVKDINSTKKPVVNQTPESIISELDSLTSNESYAKDSVNNLIDDANERQEDVCADEPYHNADETNEVFNSEETTDSSEIIGDIPVENKASEEKSKNKKTLKESLLGFFPKKEDKIPERIRKIVFLCSMVAIIVCGYVVADYYIDNYRTANRYDDVMDQYSAIYSEPEIEDSSIEDDGVKLYPLPGAQRLLDINSEVVGVINIPDTEVNYPVMQSDDLEKYLNKNIMGEDARAGSLFLDYRNRFDHVVDGKLTEENSDNLIIYGHNMANDMMFGSLKKYRDYDYYYGEHPIIELNSNYACYTYKIFAFFIIDSDDKSETAFDCWNYLDFEGEDEFYYFVNEAKRRTLRLNDVDVKYGDKLLTLSTCNPIFGNDGGGKLIVMARLVRDGEDPYEGTQNSTTNPNIKWPSLYYKYNQNEKYDPDAEFIPYGEVASVNSGNEE